MKPTLPLLALIVLLATAFPAAAQPKSIPAFPGAEGAGAEALGGRGGEVHHVVNLNDSGPGSLRAAIEATGPRTVVFEVSGNIFLTKPLRISNPRITIAGQTAPGEGICLCHSSLGIDADDVVVRYLRCRMGDVGGREGDALSIGSGKNIILDHCSASWSTDETLSVSTGDGDLTGVTVQWCIISESLNRSVHHKGSHGYGSLIRGSKGAVYSFHHNLYAHHYGRSPRPGNYDKWSHLLDPEGLLLDFRNNVIYNWGGGHAGYNADKESITRLNYIGNYLIEGIDSRPHSVAYSEGSIHNQGHFADNAIQGVIPKDPYSLVRFPKDYTPEIIAGYKRGEPFEVPAVATDPPVQAFERVLSVVGACLPKRDSVDTRILDQVRNRTGGLLNSQSEVGGWPTLERAAAPEDTDRDGLPDEWEKERNFDPSDPSDGCLDRDSDGYTHLEEYLNELADLGNR